MRIEAYALIGDTQTAALVGPNDSIDWIYLPRFDSGACFASLLGDRQHGCWGETDGHILDAIVRNHRGEHDHENNGRVGRIRQKEGQPRGRQEDEDDRAGELPKQQLVSR